VPANTPRLRTVDLSKLDITASSTSFVELSQKLCLKSPLHANDNCASQA
jgi:hypothetical protein